MKIPNLKSWNSFWLSLISSEGYYCAIVVMLTSNAKIEKIVFFIVLIALKVFIYELSLVLLFQVVKLR